MGADAFLIGERVVLRPLREADVDGPYPGWFNDADTCAANSHHVWPYTREQALEYIRSVRQSRTDLVLAIEDSASGLHIGNVSLLSIHPVYRSAELAIVVGERDYRGRGYGREASALLVGHGFQAMNLRRIYCGTFGQPAATGWAVSLGMREEGRRRSAAFKDGRWIDVVEYGLLAEEYYEAAGETRCGEGIAA